MTTCNHDVAAPTMTTIKMSAEVGEAVSQETSSGLDVYAKPYIPQALLDVNNLPAQVIQTIGLPDIDFKRYVSSFAG